MDDKSTEQKSKKFDFKKYWNEYLIFCRYLLCIIFGVIFIAFIVSYTSDTTSIRAILGLFLLVLIISPGIDNKINEKFKFKGIGLIKYILYCILLGTTAPMPIDDIGDILALTVIPSLFFGYCILTFIPLFAIWKLLVYLKNRYCPNCFKKFEEKITNKFSTNKTEISKIITQTEEQIKNIKTDTLKIETKNFIQNIFKRIKSINYINLIPAITAALFMTLCLWGFYKLILAIGIATFFKYCGILVLCAITLGLISIALKSKSGTEILAGVLTIATIVLFIICFKYILALIIVIAFFYITGVLNIIIRLFR